MSQFLRFALGSGHCVVDLGQVREILEIGPLTPVPLMPAFVRGVMNLRGAVVPVIDLAIRFGREATEAAWQSAEVDALYRLAAAGVRVPQPYNFHDGVLLMELVTDAHGDAAPRLNDVAFTEAQALQHHATLIGEVVRMLCAGVVHGDLSEFNILLAHIPGTDGEAGADEPVIIDLPQAVDAAGNNHAQRMLMRDVGNLRDFFGQFAPALLQTDFGPEIWSLYQGGLLSNDTPLTGHYERAHADVDMQAVLREIDDARAEDAARRLRMAGAATPFQP